MSSLPYSIAQQAAEIKPAITAYGVPAQVFMGMYNEETTLGTNVTVSSAGAIGPFQFEPSTASQYGYPLTNNPSLSEFTHQANAAAHLLSDNYKSTGSWQGALAGYNAGLANLSAGLGYASQALAFSIPATWSQALGASPSAPGGTANAGGTGTAQNDVAPQPFTVGDSSNPDEDYWTAINRLSQERYWYVFSDGEIMYLADGPDLMAQNPAAMALDRLGDRNRIHSLEFTYDNTAFTYSINHKKRGKVTRHTNLAKVASPVEATLQVICQIDEVRAGDVIDLSGCGPGDGRWLVGTCRRSVFQVYSECTLVPALSPLSEQQVAGVNNVNSSILTTAGTNNTSTVGSSGPYPGVPAPMSGKYISAPPQGPQGLGTFQGYQVALWIIPELEYAQSQGWKGSITSGYRTEAGSEHSLTQYPGGAVDFGGPGGPTSAGYIARANFFAHTGGYTGLKLIPEQFPPYSAYPDGDGGHASGNGH